MCLSPPQLLRCRERTVYIRCPYHTQLRWEALAFEQPGSTWRSGGSGSAWVWFVRERRNDSRASVVQSLLLLPAAASLCSHVPKKGARRICCRAVLCRPGRPGDSIVRSPSMRVAREERPNTFVVGSGLLAMRGGRDPVRPPFLFHR